MNIFEATLKDVVLANYGNAFCGFLLCVTIPFPNNRKYFRLSKVDKSTFIAYTTINWNILYTIPAVMNASTWFNHDIWMIWGQH